jgi:hypothetical protein
MNRFIAHFGRFIGKQVVWIAKDSSRVLKITAVLPSLGGAILTSELVP